MGNWLYMQVVVDLALAGTVALLFVRLRHAQARPDWRAELGPMVETLGELLVEIENVTARAVGQGTRPVGSAAPEAPPRELPSAAPAEPGPILAPKAAASSRVEPVLALASEGLGADEIARRLGRPIGEVKLVLGLRSSFAASA